jgi:hypothetical protein
MSTALNGDGPPPRPAAMIAADSSSSPLVSAAMRAAADAASGAPRWMRLRVDGGAGEGERVSRAGADWCRAAVPWAGVTLGQALKPSGPGRETRRPCCPLHPLH